MVDEEGEKLITGGEVDKGGENPSGNESLKRGTVKLDSIVEILHLVESNDPEDEG